MEARHQTVYVPTLAGMFRMLGIPYRDVEADDRLMSRMIPITPSVAAPRNDDDMSPIVATDDLGQPLPAGVVIPDWKSGWRQPPHPPLALLFPVCGSPLVLVNSWPVPTIPLGDADSDDMDDDDDDDMPALERVPAQ